MKMFSERHGFRKITEIQIDGMNDDLKYSLWNVFISNCDDYLMNFVLEHFLKESIYIFTRVGVRYYEHIGEYCDDEEALSRKAREQQDVAHLIKNRLFQKEWYEFYDFVDCIIKCRGNLTDEFNCVLERENSGYRIVNGLVVPIISKDEIAEVEQAINIDGKYSAVSKHLEQALILLSNREKPDYRHSINESMQALECLTKILINDDKCTLGQALKELKKLETEHILNKFSIEYFEKLWGWSCESTRHAKGEPTKITKITKSEARFVLISVSAFINYQIAVL